MIKLVLTQESINEERKVINPLTMLPLDDNGVLVRKIDSYWNNRISDNDVVVEVTKAPLKKDKDS